MKAKTTLKQLCENHDINYEALKGLFRQARELLEKGECFGISNFGKFSLLVTKPRKRYVPSLGREIKVPAKKKVTFQMSKKWKEELNK